jgi:Zn-dependent protease
MSELNPAAGGHEPVARPLEITTFYSPEVAPAPRPVPRFVRPASRRSAIVGNPAVALAFFLASCVSVFCAGLAPSFGFFGRTFWIAPYPAAYEQIVQAYQQGHLASVLPGMAKNGAIYFGALMAILIAHEMGHFLQARWNKVPATLPYFIPFPISPFGTMGAVIFQGPGSADRRKMFDIAISGPLAGLALTIPITIIGLHQVGLQRYDPTLLEPIYGSPPILAWMIEWIKGPLPPGFALRSDNPWLFAGWVGIFITALNLVPIGQLDGGHILYTLIGRRAHAVAYLLLALALAFMYRTGEVTYGLMLVLLAISGPRHPPTADDSVPLGAGRILLGWLTLSFVIVGFTIVPIQFPNPERIHQQRQEPERERMPPGQLIDVRAARPAAHRPVTVQLAQRDFMNRSASRESCSSLVNIRRQILVAAARSGSARPKASTTIQPSYLVSLSVRNVVSQSTCPVPGVPRSFSEM